MENQPRRIPWAPHGSGRTYLYRPTSSSCPLLRTKVEDWCSLDLSVHPLLYRRRTEVVYLQTGSRVKDPVCDPPCGCHKNSGLFAVKLFHLSGIFPWSILFRQIFLCFFSPFYLCLAQFTKIFLVPWDYYYTHFFFNVWTEVHVEHTSSCSSGYAEGESLLSRGHYSK